MMPIGRIVLISQEKFEYIRVKCTWYRARQSGLAQLLIAYPAQEAFNDILGWQRNIRFVAFWRCQPAHNYRQAT